MHLVEFDKSRGLPHFPCTISEWYVTQSLVLNNASGRDTGHLISSTD